MKMRLSLFRGTLSLQIAAAIFVLAPQAFASELLVSNNDDSGPGSLRQAILDNNASGGLNTIVFANVVTGTIRLTSGELLVTRYVTILGPGSARLAVDGNGANRIFHISGAANAVHALIAGLTFTNSAGIFGAIYNDHATLTLSNCVVTGNQVSGIFNDGSASTNAATLYVIGSTISSNTVNGGLGAGIYNLGGQGAAYITVAASTLCGNTVSGSGTVGGAIFNDGNGGVATTAVSDSTFSSNSAPQGGAIWNTGATGGNGILNIDNSTFSGNSASLAAGAIFSNGAGGSALLTLANTILNAGASGANLVNNGSSVVSHGYNLSSDNGSGLLTNTTDQINTDPLLGPLADNGGPTRTHAPLPGSPAIDKGNSFGATTDQRGEPRPFDFPSIPNATGGDGSDIGAFEVGRPRLAIQPLGNSVLLSWLLYYPNFTLESSTNVALSNSWVIASGSAVMLGDQYQQTNEPVAGTLFFRLRGP